MPELTECVTVDAAPEHVWAVLVDWAGQGRWMLATDVAPVDGDGRGVGGRLAATTGVRLRGRRRGVLDTMEITRWEPPRLVEVRHTGRVIRGRGVFEVWSRGSRAGLAWTEGFDLPLGRVGRLGWPVVRPLVRAGLRLSLRRFAEVARNSAG